MAVKHLIPGLFAGKYFVLLFVAHSLNTGGSSVFESKVQLVSASHSKVDKRGKSGWGSILAHGGLLSPVSGGVGVRIRVVAPSFQRARTAPAWAGEQVIFLKHESSVREGGQSFPCS